MTGGSLVVAVIAGGPSSEAAVSRTSGAAVARALQASGHRSRVLELESGLLGALGSGEFDVAFPTTHGPLGEDGCLQGLLEVLGLPYVGSGVLASALAMSKPHAKAQFRWRGLPVADEAIVRRGEALERRAAEIRQTLGASVVVKPATGGSAIGVSRIAESDSDASFVAALEQALAVDALVLVERFVLGDEVTCAVLENEAGDAEALPPTLILPKAADWYDFRSRYAPGGSEHRCPAPFEPAVTTKIQRIAEAAHRTLGARDLSRVDFVVGHGREPSVTLLEVNTLPGMTATSLFPEAAAVRGIGFDSLCDSLVRRARARPARKSPAVVPMP
jgi:D-alanine-D-alanine ligase